MTEQRQSLGIIDWFAHNHVAANILMFLFLIGGLVSIATMRTESFPSIDPKLITVSVVYPGATPYEVADSITNRIEETLLGIEGVKRISSIALEGYGIVNIELKDFANSDDTYNDVETQVNSLSDFPPEEAERPIINRVKPTPSVLSLALHGEVSEYVLRYWAETIEEELRSLPGVALTRLRGIRDYEISIEISENALRQYGLSLQAVREAIVRFSADIPAGSVETGRGDILLRVQEQRYTGKEFESIVLRTLPDGSRLRIGDIGRVVDGFEDINLVSRFNGQRAAFIDIFRSETEDTLAVANAAKQYLETVELPQGLNLSLQRDDTVNLRDRISLMLRNAILGFMLVFLILLLFLDLKLAFWTSAAIPISFLGGLMTIHFLGYSLNMISLFALIVVLGIVVDDAIVTGESIFDAQEKDRHPDKKIDHGAVMRGVKAVIAPVTIGVLTTIVAFAPLSFSTGTLGQIIRAIPVVVIAILFVSLIEAYFILPAHLSHPGTWSRGIVAGIRDQFAKGLNLFVEYILLPVARFSMTWRYASVALFLAIAILTAGMFRAGIIRFIFFPQVEADEITVTAEMPQGTPFEITRNTMLRIEKAAADVGGFSNDDPGDLYQSLSVSIGEQTGDFTPVGNAGGSQGGHLGQLTIQLLPSDFRTKSSGEIEKLIREKIQDLPNIKTLEFQSSAIGGEADIEIELSHGEEDQLNRAASDLKERLQQTPGMIDITDSHEPGKTEYIFELTDEGLAVGLTPLQLGQQLRAAFFGLEAQRFQRGRSEVIAYVRYPKDERENLARLNNTRIRLEDGTEVPLSRVAHIQEQPGYSEIRTVDGRRIVSVAGDVNNDVTTPNVVMRTLTEKDLPELQRRYPGLSYSFEGESREQGEDLASLANNMMIALLLIYVLLGSLLRSYIQPIIIMSAIPFGVVGAVWGHIFMGQDLTFISLFGVVALMGVVVNDSVVLVDYFNQQRAQGLRTYESILNAVQRRFRPILLTTMTTSLGLLPMLMEKSMQARFLIPMVISLATGILFASVVILLLVPNLVMILEDVKRTGRWMMGKIKKTSSPANRA